jgi:hypothetical protein
LRELVLPPLRIAKALSSIVTGLAHSTAEINGQPLVKEYDDPYNKASNSVNIDINPTNEQTIKGEVDDSS